jgi:hypothetical protein
MPPVIVSQRRTMYTVGLVVSFIALLVTGGWVLPHLGLFPPVVLLVVMTTVGVFTFAYLLATGPYVFKMDEHGIHVRARLMGGGRFAWDDLESAHVVVAEGRGQVGLDLRESALAGRFAISAELLRALKKDAGAHVIFPPEAMGPEPAEKHVATLDRYVHEPQARAELR